MTIFLTILHVLVSIFLILVVLAQQGKGQDLASAFGGSGSATTFGARGTATLLHKVTAVSAVLFMLTSLGLTYFRTGGAPRTVVPDTPPPAQSQPAPPPAEAPTTTAPESGGETPESEETVPEAEGKAPEPKSKQGESEPQEPR